MNDIPAKNLREISGFKETPEGWENFTVEDLCRVGRGRVISVDEINANPGVFPVYSSQTRDKGRMGSIASYDFDGEYVTWTTDGENAGTVFYREGRFNCTNVCGTLFPIDQERIDLKFLAYHLGEVAKNYVSYIGNPKLMNGVMAQVGLIIPNKKSQKNIAHILTTADNLIEKTQSLIEKYTAAKQGMMHDLFTRGIDVATGQLRPSYEEAPQLYKETELGWVPKEWDVRPLGDFLSLITYGFTNPMPEAGVGPWMITAANVNGGCIDYASSRHTSQDAYDTLLTQKSKPKIGDILLTKDGTLGRLAIVDREEICINQSVALLRCNDIATSKYIKLMLESQKYQQKMLDDAGGSAIKHIYITVVDKMPVAIPKAMAEKNKIFEAAEALIAKIKKEADFLGMLSDIKKGLMQDLLTGKVRVHLGEHNNAFN